MTTNAEAPALGRLIGADEAARRDCVHTPVAALCAAEWIPVGWHFRVEGGLAYRGDGSDAERGHDERTVGVVDPYLQGEGVERGRRFWGFLYPGTVTGMRHLWSHPAFAPAKAPPPPREMEAVGSDEN